VPKLGVTEMGVLFSVKTTECPCRFAKHLFVSVEAKRLSQSRLSRGPGSRKASSLKEETNFY
jgi:hypothetical protein